MKNNSLRLVIASASLMLAITACSLTRPTPIDPAAAYQATLQTAVAQTLAVQNTATSNVPATINALAQANTATAQAATQAAAGTQSAAQATGAALAAQATAGAQSAQATAQAGSSARATALAQSAQATAWSWSATATALAFPPPNPLPPPAGRIRFAPGATSANVDGSLAQGTSADYLIEAGAQQNMLVSVYSPNSDVYLGVTTATGAPLLRTSAGQTSFTGQLPATQDYRLTVAAPRAGSNYTLQVIIPARIQFAPGAVSASIPGYLAGGQVNYYQAWAKAGQRMTVSILSPNNDIYLTVYGLQDGQPLVRSQMGLSSWSDVLNVSQDYMIQAVSTGGSANYTIEVIIQ